MKYRKKPIIIDAIRFGGSSTAVGQVKHWMETGEYIEYHYSTSDFRSMEIETLEGTMIASPGDYIIKGINGEFYPCKPDIFEKTYEEVE